MKFKITNPEKVALLVIDMENDFVKSGSPMYVPMANEAVPNIKKLIEICRENGATVIYTTHVHNKDRNDMGLMSDFWPPIDSQTALVDNTDGIEIYSELKPQEGELIIKKHRYSAFYQTDLDIYLQDKEIETIIITGTVTNMCCDSTARDAQFRNYKVLFISDATGTMNHQDLGAGMLSAEEVQKATLISLSNCVAEVISSNEVLNRFNLLA